MTVVKLIKVFSLERLLIGLLGLFMVISVGSQPALASAEEGEDSAGSDAPVHLEMKPISVPIRRKSGAIRYYMFLTVSLEFDDDDKKDYARKVMPRLRDAFLQDMSGHSVLHKDKSRGMDFELIKNRLKKQAVKVLHKRAPNRVNIVTIHKGG